MNKKLILLCISLICLLAAVIASGSDAPEGVTVQHETGLIIEPLRALSGEAFDRAFYSLMIPHHRGAAEMSRQAMETATDADVKRWAGDIVRVLTGEIGEMERAVEAIGGVDRTLYDAMARSMREMVESAWGERDYMVKMITHNGSSARMAGMAKGRTENAEVLKIADRILSTQQTRAREMRDWLGEDGVNIEL